MAWALYGPHGLFRRAGAPATHFRTSAHTGAIFAAAIARLLAAVDKALGSPDLVDLVDVGAGGGELLRNVLAVTGDDLLSRLRPVAVELAPRPAGLPGRIAWVDEMPEQVAGLIVATEWLDNVPFDVAARGDDQRWRYVLVDGSGSESLGAPLAGTDLEWLARWWPGAAGGTPDARDGGSGFPAAAAQIEPEIRAEIGAERDAQWARTVGCLVEGLALAVDYGHLRAARPVFGTLTGFRDGREVPPVPDGSCDLTAHVAVDAVAAAGEAVAGLPAQLLRQADALRALGVDGRRPPLDLARTDPAVYVRALAAASQAAELTDPEGLGGHFWVAQPVGAVAAALRIAP
jgi:SAM-dependent MidA family methyltransferase